MNHSDRNLHHSVGQSVARDIVKSIDTLIQEAIQATRPMEVDPFRSRLFELFVTADGAGLIRDDRETPVAEDSDDFESPDLSADSLLKSLASRWGLDSDLRASAASQKRLDPDQLERMRVLWSVTRMWMEWTYAWKRWAEFHQQVPSCEVEGGNATDGK